MSVAQHLLTAHSARRILDSTRPGEYKFNTEANDDIFTPDTVEQYQKRIRKALLAAHFSILAVQSPVWEHVIAAWREVHGDPDMAAPDLHSDMRELEMDSLDTTQLFVILENQYKGVLDALRKEVKPHWMLCEIVVAIEDYRFKQEGWNQMRDMFRRRVPVLPAMSSAVLLNPKTMDDILKAWGDECERA